MDITLNTNVKEVFLDYKQKLLNMKNQFPETKYIHMSVPLTSKPEGMRAIKQMGKNIKKIIEKTVFDHKDNINRNKFNDMLRAEYTDNAPVFDLAFLESAGRQKESVYIKDGVQIRTLAKKIYR